MKRVDFKSVEITGGFWKQRQELVRDVTVYAVYDRFKETGRFDALKCDKNATIKPHIFWDSDVAKWIEGVAYLLLKEKNTKLEGLVDQMVDDIFENQDKDGYFNSYYLVNENEVKFSQRDNHELYCLGHLIEAGVAYFEATGKKKLLDVCCKYVGCVYDRFAIKKDTGFTTPGHEEIELALVRLYEVTGDKMHLDLAMFFLNERGKDGKLRDWAETRYNQSHAPVREQKTAEGHSVRATYLYCAMADIALKTGDECLKNACEAIFDDIVNTKMYITGGIGSSSAGEAFTVPYDLPNMLAYTESCAAIGLILFAHRMLLLTNDAKYSSIIERALYNGFLSSISLNGRAFFYCNPLEIYPQMIERDSSVTWKSVQLPVTVRQEVFDCSCCPPNIVRFIPSLGNLLYTTDESTIYLHQFITSRATIGKTIIEQETSYPNGNTVKIKVSGKSTTLCVRIPEFCKNKFENTQNGYAVFSVNDGDEITLDFDMEPKFVESNSKVLTNAGKCALVKGPVVYCLEGVDNEINIKSLIIDTQSKIENGYNKELDEPTLIVDAYYKQGTDALYSQLSHKYERTRATLIPYYAFANRGQSQMLVWFMYK